MSMRAVNVLQAPLTVAISLATVVLVLAVMGCAPPTTGPGTPDLEMLRSAIEAKSKTDALAALKLSDAGGKPNDLAQANNPLANFTAFNIHNYYIGKLTDLDDEDANQAWARFAMPISIGDSLWIMRASLPFNTFPVAPDLDSESGLGDLNVFASCLFDTGNPALTVGVGPQITAPTATEDELGSEKWSGGLVHVLFNAASKKLQYGYLLSWQASFAGEDDRDDVNVGAFQPFVFYQLGGGTYLRSSAVTSYNFEDDTYGVPIGLGIGQVIPTKEAVYNFWIEPQFSVDERGSGRPEWMIFLGLNTQFK